MTDFISAVLRTFTKRTWRMLVWLYPGYYERWMGKLWNRYEAEILLFEGRAHKWEFLCGFVILIREGIFVRYFLTSLNSSHLFQCCVQLLRSLWNPKVRHLPLSLLSVNNQLTVLPNSYFYFFPSLAMFRILLSYPLLLVIIIHCREYKFFRYCLGNNGWCSEGIHHYY